MRSTTMLRISTALIMAAVCGLFQRIRAEPPQADALRVEDALKFRYLGHLTAAVFSPDGKWLAYTIRDNQRAKSVTQEAYARTGVPEWATGTDICIVQTQSGEVREITGGQADNWLPVWSPDGHYLAFISDRDSNGEARIWIWDKETNRLSRISDVSLRAEEIEWTPDSGSILLTALPQGLSEEEYAKKIMVGGEVQTSLSKSVADSVTLFESKAAIPDNKATPMSPPWNLDRSLRDLCLVEVSSGNVVRIVHNKRVETYLLSPDGVHIAYTTSKRFEKPGGQQVLFDLVTVDIRTKRERVVCLECRFDYDGASFSWSPDGVQLSFQAGGMEEKTFDSYVVDVRNGNPLNVTAFSQPVRVHRKALAPLWDTMGHIYFIRDEALWQASSSSTKPVQVARLSNSRKIRQIISKPGHLLWSPDGGKSALVMTHDNIGKQDGVYKINLLTGETTKLLEQGQCYTCANLTEQFAVSEDGQQLSFVAEDAEHDADLWVSDATFEKPRRLTHFNPQFDKYKMGAARLIDWLSDDGVRLQGALLLPADYQEGTLYPLVVWVYGGHSLSDNVNRFGLAYSGPLNMQLLATRGYAVFLPDAPQHLGTPMLDLAKTVLPGVNKAIEMGIADPDRLCVMGHSYGGYSALALIVQTRRFKAAIEVDGPGDLVANYGAMAKDGTAFGTSVDEQGQGLMGGTPWEFRERYIENSPFFYLNRIETPLMIVHGADDDSVAPFLGDQVFVGLRRLGKEVEYVRYSGEGHSPFYWSYANQLDFCNRFIAWLDKHLKINGN